MTKTAPAGARRNIRADITARNLADLEQGVRPWRKPWDNARIGMVLPRRANGAPYRGANVVLLWSAACAMSYDSPYWLTFKQAAALGARVRRGAHGQIVVYWGSAVKQRLTALGKTTDDLFRFLKSYVVFNACQIDGLDASFYPAACVAPPMAISTHEAWFKRLGIARTLCAHPCYIPARDAIGMPPIAAFDSAQDYAATLNHECCHATGAPHRLNRGFSGRFADAAYAGEELVAEIGAAMLGAHMGLAPFHIHDHSAYIGHWMKLLAHDDRAFLTAAAKAQAAVDWLLAAAPLEPVEGSADEQA